MARDDGAGNQDFRVIQVDNLLSDPASVARMILNMSRTHRSRAHYKAYKKGGRYLDYGLTGVEDLRRIWPSAIIGFIVTILCYENHYFYDGDDPTTAVENEILRLLLIFIGITLGLSFTGYVVHKNTGGPTYQNPDAFRDYFAALEEVLGNHPQARIILDPDPDNVVEMQQFSTFHFKLHEYLLSLGDDRAATYMWTSFCQKAPLVSQRRYFVESINEAEDRDSPLFIDGYEIEQRQQVLRRCFWQQFGVVSEHAFQERMRAVLVRAEEIRLRRPESNPHRLLEQNLLGKLAHSGRQGGLLGRLCEIADEGVTRQEGHCERVKYELLRMITERAQRLAQHLQEALVANRYLDVSHHDISEAVFRDVFEEIIQYLTHEIREHPLERQTIATGRGTTRLENAEEVAARHRRCLESIPTVIERRKALMAPLFKQAAEEELHEFAAPRDRVREEALRETRIGFGVGEDIRQAQHVLTQGDRWSDDETGMIAALNEAMHELGINFSVNPMSLRLLESAMVGQPEPAEHAGAVSYPVENPLNLNLMSGHIAAPLVVNDSGRVHVTRVPVHGYLNPPVTTSDLDLGQEAGRQEHRWRARCYREAARRGWLKPQRPCITDQDVAFNAAHSAWRLPDFDNLPTTDQDFNPGAISIEFAKSQRRSILPRATLPGQVRRSDNDRARDLAKSIRRFVGHMDPLDVADGLDLSEQLDIRAKNLAHLFHDDKNYTRFEHWVSCDSINLASFMQLNDDDQVKAVVILLSGPDFSKFTALSILYNAEFPLAKLNDFMRAYVRYMQEHINRHRPEALTTFFDPAHMDHEITNYQDIRLRLFVEQLILMTDLEPGSVNFEYDRGSRAYQWQESDGRMKCYLRQHGRKSGIILNALATTLTPEAFERHLGVVREYFHQVGHDRMPSLDDLIHESQLLVTLLNGTSARTDDRLLRHDNDPTDIVERTFQRNVLSSMRWLITYYRAKQHLGKLFWIVEDVRRQQAILMDMVAVNPESVIHVFDLRIAEARQSMFDAMPTTSSLELLECLIVQPTQATRKHLVHCFNVLLVEDQGYHHAIRRFLLRNAGMLHVDMIHVIKEMIDHNELDLANALPVIRIFILAILEQRDGTAVAKGETLYELYRILFPDLSVFDFCSTVLGELWESQKQECCQAISYLLHAVQYSELGNASPWEEVVNVLSAGQNEDVVRPVLAQMPHYRDDRTVQIHCEVLKYWVRWDHLREDERHAEDYLRVALGYASTVAEEQAAFGAEDYEVRRDIRCRITTVLLQAVSQRQYRDLWSDVNNILVAAGMTYPNIGAGTHLSGPRMLYYLFDREYITSDFFFAIVSQLIRQGFDRYMWSLVQMFFPRHELEQVPPQLSENDLVHMQRAADSMMSLLVHEEMTGGQQSRTVPVCDAMLSLYSQYPEGCRNPTLDYLVTYALRYCYEVPADDEQHRLAAYRVLNRLYLHYHARNFPVLPEAAVQLDRTFPLNLRDQFREFINEFVNEMASLMVEQLRSGQENNCEDQLGRAWNEFKEGHLELNDIADFQNCPADWLGDFQQFIFELSRDRREALIHQFDAALLLDAPADYIDPHEQITYLDFVFNRFVGHLHDMQIKPADDLSARLHSRCGQYQRHWDGHHLGQEQFMQAMVVPHLAQHEMHEQNGLAGEYVAMPLNRGYILQNLIKSIGEGFVSAATLTNENRQRHAFMNAWNGLNIISRLNITAARVYLPNFHVDHDVILDMLIALVKVPHAVVGENPGRLRISDVVMLFINCLLGGQVSEGLFNKLSTELLPAWIAFHRTVGESHSQLFQQTWINLPDAFRADAGPDQPHGCVKAQLTMAYANMLYHSHRERSWRFWPADVRPYARDLQNILDWMGVSGMPEDERRPPQRYLDDESYLSRTQRDRVLGCDDNRGFKQFMKDCIDLDLRPRRQPVDVYTPLLAINDGDQ